MLFSVPVTKVRFTDCAPTWDSAVFIMPIAKLSVAMPTPLAKAPSWVTPIITASKAATNPKRNRHD